MYPLVSGIIFALVAVAHLVRAIQGWPVQVAEWSIPMAVSWAAVLVAGALAVWAFSGRRQA